MLKVIEVLDAMPTPQTILRIAAPSPLYTLFDYILPDEIKQTLTQPVQPGVRAVISFGRQRLIGIVMEITDKSDFPLPKLKPVVEILDSIPVLSETLIQMARFAADYYHHPIGEVCAAMLPVNLRKGMPLKNKPLPAMKPAMMIPDKDDLVLNSEQLAAVSEIKEHLSQFKAYLLQGVTGSGKTEVYLQVMAEVLRKGQQILLLVPEIGLTPQTLGRIQRRFPVGMALLHSRLTNRQRQLVWEAAFRGDVKIVIGTRSALFTPFHNLGIIIIDEEHDLSFKQQEGFRYSARDLAVFRAKIDNIPVVLGSATPSLESLYNASQARYHILYLQNRAGNAVAPYYYLIDLRQQPLHTGVSIELRDKIKEQLALGHQVLIFLNRRGYAPVLICHECGWSANCSRCDARMTLHQGIARLQCHHCGFNMPKPAHCPDCQSTSLVPVGVGTERLEKALTEMFAEVPILRIDSDTTRHKGAMQEYVELVQEGKACILLGTQMLAKGHHFPNVTLAAILDADSGLYSADFRATERLAQLLLQVGGRAGRAEKAGYVFIQTHLPQHPLLQQLLQSGFSVFAESALQQRRQSHLPPFGCLALLRAESVAQEAILNFLTKVKQEIQPLLPSNVQLLGPIPAAMARRAGVYRMQLLLQANQRSLLHTALEALTGYLEKSKNQAKVRWILDVDPQEVL
ncbi:MAG: priA [Gammaproteobacteria bacterium]|jgi:primosomal protein N' (replication factor Y)|nr:priA [Gammaproteobacteria bacterium]